MPKNPDFGTFGRYQELLVEEMSLSQKKAYEYTMKERGQVPGPYKIWLQNPKIIEAMVPLGAYYQGHSSLSKAEIEIRPATRQSWPRTPDPAQPVPLTGNEIAHMLASMIICFERRPTLGSPVMLATPALPPVAAGSGKKPGNRVRDDLRLGYRPHKGVSRAVSEITLNGRLPRQSGRLDAAAGTTTVIWPGGGRAAIAADAHRGEAEGRDER
jgi:hypothetical protein